MPPAVARELSKGRDGDGDGELGNGELGDGGDGGGSDGGGSSLRAASVFLEATSTPHAMRRRMGLQARRGARLC